MIEHPDFMTQEEIEEAMTVVIQYGHEDDEEDDDEDDPDDAFHDDGGCSGGCAGPMHRRAIVLPPPSPERRQQSPAAALTQLDFSKQKKSIQSLGGAMTLAMLCVGMGFTCCENLVYIFIYSGSSLNMEVSVLVARSLFPVHLVAAALQSLRVIDREIEKVTTPTTTTRLRQRTAGQPTLQQPTTTPTGLGRILTPAILFHGTFDFTILWLNFVSDQITFADSLSLFLSAFIMISAIIYYIIAATRQRSRLQVIDATILSPPSSGQQQNVL